MAEGLHGVPHKCHCRQPVFRLRQRIFNRTPRYREGNVHMEIPIWERKYFSAWYRAFSAYLSMHLFPAPIRWLKPDRGRRASMSICFSSYNVPCPSNPWKMGLFCHFSFFRNRRNGFCASSTNQMDVSKRILFYLNTCTNHELSFDIGKHLFSVTAGWHQASGFDISSYFELK